MAPDVVIEEFDVVALTRDVKGAHLEKGDLGTVVDILAGGKGYKVEFVLQTGFTAALEDLDASTVRPLKEGELERKQYREWKPEWTGILGYVPPISKIPEHWIPPDGHPTDAHYLGYVDGAGR